MAEWRIPGVMLGKGARKEHVAEPADTGGDPCAPEVVARIARMGRRREQIALCGECLQDLVETFSQRRESDASCAPPSEGESGLHTCPSCGQTYEIGGQVRGIATVTHRADRRRKVLVNGLLVHACPTGDQVRRRASR